MAFPAPILMSPFEMFLFLLNHTKSAFWNENAVVLVSDGSSWVYNSTFFDTDLAGVPALAVDALPHAAIAVAVGGAAVLADAAPARLAWAALAVGGAHGLALSLRAHLALPLHRVQ